MLRERLWGHSWHFAPSQPSSIQGAGAGSDPQHWQSPISPVAELWEAGCGMGVTCPAGHARKIQGHARIIQGHASPRSREPPRHPLAPSLWEQGQPVLSPQNRPLLPSWREQGWGRRGEPWQSLPWQELPGLRVPALSQIRPAGALLLPQATGRESWATAGAQSTARSTARDGQ